MKKKDLIADIKMANLKFANPPMPFMTSLEGGMPPGRLVRVKGTVKPQNDAEDVAFNFAVGRHELDDIVFNITFNFDDSTVNRNTYSNHKWGAAEVTHEMPFHPTEPFELEVHSKAEEFTVKVNGKEFCEYKHRRDPKNIVLFQVEGELTLELVEIRDDLAILTQVPDLVDEDYLPDKTAPVTVLAINS